MDTQLLGRKQAVTLALLAMIVVSLPARAADAAASPGPGTDCPAAFRPFSTNTSLLDILLSPEATAVVDRDLPGFLSNVPPFLKKSTPPTLADILTIRILGSEFVPMPKSSLDKLDTDLAAIPVTHETALARCARYDETPPALPSSLPHPALLVFSKSNGFRDDPSVNAAEALLKTLGERQHWNLFFTENAAVFNAADLKHFDAVVWNNVSGDVLTIPQRRDFKAYIENGGGFAGFHGSGGDPYCDWDWYAETLIGAHFWTHPMSPQFQAAKIHIDDKKASIVRGMDAEWTMTDEWYSFRNDPRKNGAHILATLDETTYKPLSGKTDISMGDHPISWTQCINNGRSFYSAIGHRPESYSEPNTIKLMEQGIAWAAGLGQSSCRAGHEVEAH
jgi:uncharacterized protein